MSSLQQPAQKRPRCESNNVSNAENICNTSNTNNNLLSLPDEALSNIISYSMPRKECQVWEGIGILSQTCKSFRRFAQTYAPTRIVLKDFKIYCPISGSDRSVDARVGFLSSLRDCSWKRQHLKELHVDPESILLRWRVKARGIMECNDIRVLLQTLLTTQTSFPKLEWLDIELQSSEVFTFNLIDAQTFQRMPDALPSLHKLCLSQCFKSGIREISPCRLKRFFNSLHTPLTSLSLSGPHWMTDAHIEAIMPIIGENLVRLELVDCVAYDGHTLEEETLLSDNSLIPIAQHCKHLKSFSMVGSNITTGGLDMILRENTSITTLNLSDSHQLNSRAVDIISKYLPRLEVLRNYWPNAATDWLSDDSLIALVDAQERESGGSGIFLKQIGLWADAGEQQLTIRGIKYAIEKGVKEIEINKKDLYKSIVDLGSAVQFYQAHYDHYIDGSLYEREPVHADVI